MIFTSYEPLAVLRNFQRELDRLWPERDACEVGDGTNVPSHWSPAVDVREEPERFIIQADVPGVKPSDIQITMEGNMLTLKGVRTEQKEEKSAGHVRTERSQGSFYRRFSLPDSANPDQIKASSNHGVLEISLPKQEKVQPRRIEVQS